MYCHSIIFSPNNLAWCPTYRNCRQVVKNTNQPSKGMFHKSGLNMASNILKLVLTACKRHSHFHKHWATGLPRLCQSKFNSSTFLFEITISYIFVCCHIKCIITDWKKKNYWKIFDTEKYIIRIVARNYPREKRSTLKQLNWCMKTCG